MNTNTIIKDQCHELYKGHKVSTSTLPALEYTVKDGVISTNLNWYKNNITSISIPQLKNITKYWEKVKVNKHVSHQFVGVFEDIEKEGLLKYILSYGGVYNPRFTRNGTGKLSQHAIGLAIDINMKWNQLGKIGANINEEGTIIPLIPIFNKYGFLSGSTFHKRDDQHFQVEYIL